ncbi:MAG: malonate decarboxylase acyl carrier protein [Sutterella sp. 54_7]|nr:MAG: malonate decarboxylase acyl carrier protein [Sutterella sp. 54_7]
MKDESNLFPKPGLVNWRSSGSHTDMTIEMMHASVDAISSSFKAMADAAKKADRNNPESLSALRMTVGAIGRAAEVAMLKAHRGAIYAQGLLTVAAGLAEERSALAAERVAALAGHIASIPDPGFEAPATSHGLVVRKRLGLPGAREEAQSGFEHVRLFALPALLKSRKAGLSEAASQINALLALMATLPDTCIAHRGGLAGLQAVQSGAKQVLDLGGVGLPEGSAAYEALCRQMEEQKLSPGGSADLLAATLFLDRLLAFWVEERNHSLEKFMESLELKIPAGQPIKDAQVQMGVVASGDMEVLYDGVSDKRDLTVKITSSVDNSAARWSAIFERLSVMHGLPAGIMVIHDFGATPGVARIRIEQAIEAAKEQEA